MGRKKGKGKDKGEPGEVSSGGDAQPSTSQQQQQPPREPQAPQQAQQQQQQPQQPHQSGQQPRQQQQQPRQQQQQQQPRQQQQQQPRQQQQQQPRQQQQQQPRQQQQQQQPRQQQQQQQPRQQQQQQQPRQQQQQQPWQQPQQQPWQQPQQQPWQQPQQQPWQQPQQQPWQQPQQQPWQQPQQQPWQQPQQPGQQQQPRQQQQQPRQQQQQHLEHSGPQFQQWRDPQQSTEKRPTSGGQPQGPPGFSQGQGPPGFSQGQGPPFQTAQSQSSSQVPPAFQQNKPKGGRGRGGQQKPTRQPAGPYKEDVQEQSRRPQQAQGGPQPPIDTKKSVQEEKAQITQGSLPSSSHRERSSESVSSSSSKTLSPLTGTDSDGLKQLALIPPGTKGRKIPIESNHLSLNLGKLMSAIHYDVAIEPDTPKSLLRQVMTLFGRRHYPDRYPAFDGRKNLYAPTPLFKEDSKTDSITVLNENGRDKIFKVTIKFARTVDLSPLHDMLKSKKSPQDAIQCLDIVLRSAPARGCIVVGRSFFTPPTNRIISLGEGMEMYYGFFQSAIRGWKPLLNVDVAHKAFPQGMKVLDLICDLGSDFRNRMERQHLASRLPEFVASKTEKFLRTLKVKYEIPNQPSSKRIYRVNGFGEAAANAKFKQEDGTVLTVADYFARQKRIRLQYPQLPTLWVGNKDRTPKILLPIEFCTVEKGQAINRKMTENQTSAMIKVAATSTEERKRKIMDTLKTANYNNDPCIREFGFSVGNQFEQLEARVLAPPTLEYARQFQITPSKGVWRSDRSQFLKGAKIDNWTVAYATRMPPRFDDLAKMVYKFGGQSGMMFTKEATQPFVHITGRQSQNDIINYMRDKRDFDLIFVVVPNNGPQYSYVKQAAELKVGCLTQCIKEKTLGKLNPQTVVNILLKVNSKMNGTNHCLSKSCLPTILRRPCMIMGADVTHPSPDARDIPSVAAVTASHDPKAFRYNICWRLQPPKMEIIGDLCDITTEQLLYFFKANNGYKPESIVFFRDGVSEGQFADVQSAEIRAIRSACKKLQADDYEPKITFLVVQKRHHTRLFPRNPKDSEDRNMNVPAGTCVDTQITNPMMQDFYLVSHASIQGVAKPTKYCTLWDDNHMSNDDIQELTYHLCHMFTRCNRSVSYPAPTYYAHLAAARAKVYIENDRLEMNNLKRCQERYVIRTEICKDKPMFFV